MSWFSRSKKEAVREPEAGIHTPAQKVKTVKDPVCGMDVRTDAPVNSVYEGQTYYFCSSACKKAFGANPTKYIKGAQHDMSGHSCCGM